MKAYLIHTDQNNGEKAIKCVIDKKEANIADLKAKMCAEQKLFSGQYERYCPIEMTKTLFVLPRFAYHDLNSGYELMDGLIFNDNSCNYGELKIDIWQENRSLIDKIYAKVLQLKGLIVKLDTGYGKTVIASELIRMLGKKTVIIVKNSDLQEQMYSDILTNVSIEFEEISLLGGKLKRPRNERTKILICIINSVRKIDCMDFWSQFGLAIFDECHAYCSKINSIVLKNCQTEYLIGLSANPEKPWNNKIIKYHIGPILDCDEIVTKKEFNGVVNIIKYKGSREYTNVICNKNGCMSVAKMVEQFMHDTARNLLIVEVIHNAVLQYKYGFVFGMRNDFLYAIAKLFAEKYPETTYAILNADTKPADKTFARESASIIFTNYAYSEGLNIPRMLFIVHASPYKTNGKQITGRTLRGNVRDLRAIYDIIDVNTPLKNQYHERKKNYEERGYSINNITSVFIA